MRNFLLGLILLMCSYTSFSQADSSKYNIEGNFNENEIRTVIPQREIEHSNAKTLASLLNEQAGLVVNGAFQPMGSLVNIYMEGYIGGKVLIELDGLPVWDPSSIAENYFDLNYIPLSIIEEIIIIHGSHSTKYGSGAIAGVINIITKKKESLKKLNAIAETGVGNRGTSFQNLQLWGSVNKLAYQVNYSGYHTNGFSYAQDTTEKNGFDNDGFKSQVLNSYLDYKPNKSFKLYSYIFYSKYKADTDADDFVDAINNYYKNSFLNTGLGFSYTKRKLSITGNYKYSDATRAYYDSIVNTEEYIGITQLLNLKVTTAFTKQISYCAGVEYRHNDFKYYSTNFSNVTTQTIYPTTYQFRAYSAIEYTSPNNRYLASIGYRTNPNNIANTDYSYYIINTYQLNKKVSIVSNISSGYTTPSIYTAKDSFVGNEKLQSERSTSFQVGIKYKKKSWQQHLMIFHNKMNNGIDFNSNISTFDNCNSFNIGGMEYESAITLLKHFIAQVNYTYTIGKEQTISRQDFTDTISYNYLVRVPKHNLNCKLQYESNRGSFITIGSKYVNSYYDIGTATTDYKMNGFFILNMNTFINISKKISLACEVENLLNNKFHDTRGYNSVPIIFNLSSKIIL